MFYAWDERGIKPSEFYKMSDEDLLIIRAFYDIKMELKG